MLGIMVCNILAILGPGRAPKWSLYETQLVGTEVQFVVRAAAPCPSITTSDGVPVLVGPLRWLLLARVGTRAAADTRVDVLLFVARVASRLTQNQTPKDHHRDPHKQMG